MLDVLSALSSGLASVFPRPGWWWRQSPPYVSTRGSRLQRLNRRGYAGGQSGFTPDSVPARHKVQSAGRPSLRHCSKWITGAILERMNISVFSIVYIILDRSTHCIMASMACCAPVAVLLADSGHWSSFSHCHSHCHCPSHT